MTHAAETRYGFEFGSATIERACSDKKKGWVMMILKTPKYPNGIQIYVTRTGKVRVYNGADEWIAACNAGTLHLKYLDTRYRV